RRAGAASRPQRAGQHPLGNLTHARPLAHRSALDEGEDLALAHPAFVDQHTFGAVDDLARFEWLAECIDLTGEVLHLAESPDRHLDGGDGVAPLIWRVQWSGCTGAARIITH